MRADVLLGSCDGCSVGPSLMELQAQHIKVPIRIVYHKRLVNITHGMRVMPSDK